MTLLSDDYIAKATADARRYQGQWCGTAGNLAAHTMRLIRERERILSMLELRDGVRIIGIAGHIGAGKSLVASMIPESTHIQWADPIYRGLSAMFDVPEEVLRGRVQKEGAMPGAETTVRHCLRTLGTEWGRDLIHPDLWVRLTMQRIDMLADQTGANVFSICGTRFPNEVAAIRERGGEVWWVSRPGDEPADCPHVSDRMIGRDDCDVEIQNGGTIDQLRASVQAAWADFLRARGVPEHPYNGE